MKSFPNRGASLIGLGQKEYESRLTLMSALLCRLAKYSVAHHTFIFTKKWLHSWTLICSDYYYLSVVQLLMVTAIITNIIAVNVVTYCLLLQLSNKTQTCPNVILATVKHVNSPFDLS